MMFARLLTQLLRGSRGRLSVALLALVSGAAVISALANVDLDVEKKLTQEFRTLGANLVVAPPHREADSTQTLSGSPLAPADPTLMDEAVLDMIESNRTPQLEAFAPYLYIVVRANAGNNRLPAVLTGTWLDEVRQLEPWWKAEGGWIDSRDDRTRCLVGRNAARQFHLAAGSPLEVSYGEKTAQLTVAGVVTAGGAEDNQIFVNLVVVQGLAGLPGKMEVAQLSVSGSAGLIETYAQHLRKALPSLEVRPIRQIAEAEGRLLTRIRLLILLMVLLILVLTSLCVLGTMAALAMERREDVGLMKALGGSIGRVVGLFLAEAGLLGAAGGILGYLVGIGLTLWIGRRVFAATIVPRWEVFPLTVALMVGVALAGALPLRLLGRVKPAVILRGE
ncbi:MAG: ABC transporter permease [Candidatus Acidiferrales bacterium]